MMVPLLAFGLAAGPWITLDSSKTSWFIRDGHPFFSFGVDCVDTGVDPAKYSAKNPSYCGLKLFPDENAWAHGVQAQLRSWGFNTLGAWSDVETFRQWCGDDRMPYTVCLHLGSYDLAPWHDLFDDHMQKAMEGAARDQIPKFRDDPYLIGYFSDNELGWWDDTLFTSYLHMKPDAPGRKALNRCLHGFYHDRMDLLKRDWITSADSIEAIRDMKLRPGSNGRQAVKQWTYELSSHYYKLCYDLIRKYDSHHLILGDRYAQYFTLPVVKASKPYIDVSSSNLGADWNDGGLSPFYLNTLHTVTGKPVMITEFYMTATENRSGDKNSSDGFPVVPTQRARADAFARYVKTVASYPFMVGAHWFQYYDEPGNGRGDGENYNMGLVDTSGVKYDEITDAAKSIDLEKLHRRGAQEAVFPASSSDATEDLKAWDRTATWIRPEATGGVADLYIRRLPEGVYFGLYSMDYADKSLYAKNQVPEADRCRLRVWLKGQKEPIDVRFGDDRAAKVVAPPGCKVHSSGGLKTTTILFVPKATRNRPVRVEFESHGRAEQVFWRSRT